MVKIAIELPDDAHGKLLDIQVERKKKKIEPTALNKIASEILVKALEKVNPSK